MSGRLSLRARVLIAAICVLALAALTVAVETAAVTPFDLGFSAALAPFRSAWLVSSFVAITSMGAGGSLVSMALVASALLWRQNRSEDLRPLWVTFLGAEACTWAVKYLLDRHRPVVLPGVTGAMSPSFPSGHTTGTTALICILACLIARDLPERRRRLEVAGAATAIVALIGFSRVFLDLHYLSDVLAGYLVALIWLMIGSALVEMAPTKRRLSHPSPCRL
jgi:undecaprenyl-diphosphatase